MSGKKEKIFLLIADFCAFNLAWVIYYLIRVEAKIIPFYSPIELLLPMFVIYLYWLLVFSFFGLYTSWYAKSRFDEFVAIVKSSGFGVFILFFAVFVDDASSGVSGGYRAIILIYWFVFIALTETGRFFIHTLQRSLLLKGIGLKKSLIIGSGDKSKKLFDEIEKYPALGYKVTGFLSTNGKPKMGDYKSCSIYNDLNDLPEIIKNENIEEVIIAIGSSEHDKLIDIISACEPFKLGMKIMPDMYDIVSGQARMNQIYGLPLIDLVPPLLPEWERKVKRMIDFLISSVTLLLFLPFGLVIALIIKIDSKGTVFYKQIRVGENGKNYHIYKFRSMVQDAEKNTGPVWSILDDPRITGFGKILRKYRLDEIPNFISVFSGKMSFIGPRPERPFFVDKFSREIPLYRRRLRVKPGITGWAQVKHKYDESLEDVRIKLQYDLYYIENISLRLDFKIILFTIQTILFGKGR